MIKIPSAYAILTIIAVTLTNATPLDMLSKRGDFVVSSMDGLCLQEGAGNPALSFCAKPAAYEQSSTMKADCLKLADTLAAASQVVTTRGGKKEEYYAKHGTCVLFIGTFSSMDAAAVTPKITFAANVLASWVRKNANNCFAPEQGNSFNSAICHLNSPPAYIHLHYRKKDGMEDETDVPEGV